MQQEFSNHNQMQQQNVNDLQQEDFQIIAEQKSSSPQDIYFDQVVSALQQIIVDQQFESIQTKFMRQNCHIFEDNEQNKMQYTKIFHNYQNQIQRHIEKRLEQIIPGFDMGNFLSLLQTRTQQIDEQILEILHSFAEFQIFKRLILDYKFSYQQEERLKVLTIKSTKIPETKKVKGNNNIFSNQGGLDLGIKPLAPLKKKKQIKQKTQQQLLVPNLILTVKPLRKS